MRILFIFRRDFRIEDNIGLNYCLEMKDSTIYPIFIFTPEQIDKNTYKSENSVQFMIESLLDLQKNIDITFCHGIIETVITDIVIKNKIDMICCNTDYTPYSIKREKRITLLAKKLNVEFKYFHDILLHEPGTILNQTGTYYQKFTPFYHTVIKIKVPEPTTKHLHNIKQPTTKYSINKTKLDTFYQYNDMIHVNGGREKALKILHHIKEYHNYNKTHDMLHINTTNLSAYLKFGCISIRECYHIMKKNLSINSPLVRQLIWREFYYHLGYGFIDRFGKALKPQYNKIKWGNNKKLFKKWCEGKTGYPIVDACMAQLNKTGYMHNRGRLIVSSFLIKNLHIDWRYGEKYFARKLVDYDVMVNQGNWQWTAGTGADSQPYFRVFNPWIQSAKFDKDALYIKKWLPQLEEIEPKYLHQWDKYYDINKYIKPIVDYTMSKKEGIQLYKMYI